MEHLYNAPRSGPLSATVSMNKTEQSPYTYCADKLIKRPLSTLTNGQNSTFKVLDINTNPSYQERPKPHPQ